MIGLIKEQFDKTFRTNYTEMYGEYKASFYAGGIYNVFLLWLEHGCQESPEALAGKLSNLLEK